jgi:hypothetical protein
VQPTDTEKFHEERREFETQIAKDERFTQGHYLISIRPTRYNPQAVQPVSRILELVNRCQVRRHGWSFPFIVRGQEATEQRSAGTPRRPKDWEEFWRMYQSGHFIYAVAYREDRPGQNASDFLDRWPLQHAKNIGVSLSGVVNIDTVIFIATLAYDFAAGLVGPLAWDESVEVNLTLVKTADRVLVSTDPRAPIRRFWQATIPQIESRHIVEVKDLLAKTRTLAVTAANEILERFAGADVQSLDAFAAQREFFGE